MLQYDTISFQVVDKKIYFKIFDITMAIQLYVVKKNFHCNKLIEI